MQRVFKMRDEVDGWNKKIDKPDCQIWNRFGHPDYSEKMPVLKCSFYFPGIVDPKVLFDAYMISARRLQWDDGVISSKDIGKPHKHLQVVHCINKAPLNFKSRDFLDKRIYFKHADAFYIYVSDVPDTVKGKEKEYERGQTVFSLFEIKYDKERDCVNLWSASSVDVRVSFGLKMLTDLLPGSMEKWGQKYLEFAT